jgi:GAF domain-containing protein
MKRTYAIRYALIGVLFGLLFPIFSTIGETFFRGLPFSIESLLQVQSTSKLLWVINTAPIFLGLFASFAGHRQDRIRNLNANLEIQIENRNQAIAELKLLQNNLEKQVSERTALLERRSSHFQAAVEVGLAGVTLRNTSELLTKITQLISKRFGFYHVGIFLLDDIGKFAILSSTNSQGGQRMLANGHRLRVGEEGIVGFVTQTRIPRIALDVGGDTQHFENPDLPETRSEMALPLIANEILIGALDIQSQEAGAFSSDDITSLQTIANMTAIAIENAEVFTQSQTALEAAQQRAGVQTRTAWDQYLSQETDFGFRTRHADPISPVSGDWTPEMKRAAVRGKITQPDSHTIAIPIIIRNQVLGVFRLKKNESSSSWAADEINLMDTIIDQVESALEGAQLFEETQRRAEREQTTSELTDKLHRAGDIENLMNIIIQEVSQTLGASSSFVQFGSLWDADAGASPENGSNAPNSPVEETR